MSSTSTIEWTDASWNPVRGCTKISPGCKNCYAKTFAERWRGIVGGESGPGARPMDESWVRSIRRQCRTYDVPFFFKQWGGTRKKLAGRLLDGRTYDEFPKIHSGLVPTAKRRRELLEILSRA